MKLVDFSRFERGRMIKKKWSEMNGILLWPLGAPEGSKRAEPFTSGSETFACTPSGAPEMHESVPKAAVVPPLPWAMRFAPIRGRENTFESAIQNGQNLG